jgi:hypothetical protein
MSDHICADRIWIYRDSLRAFQLALTKPAVTLEPVEYMRVLSRQEVEKLAGDGIDVQQYINSLLRTIEGQRRHIGKLAAREPEELLAEAAPLLRQLASRCEGCEGAGEIIRGDGNPENDHSEPCKHCKPIWDLIERIEPPQLVPPPTAPAPAQEEDDDLPF